LNKDQVKGRIREVKGSVKEAAGKLSGKESLEQEGKLQKAAGKVQAGFGDLRSNINKKE
jgi:uncharacterized protein YjbJ (UPF0337 family)